MKAAGERKAKGLACDGGGADCEWRLGVSLLPCKRCLDERMQMLETAYASAASGRRMKLEWRSIRCAVIGRWDAM
jgi:hypothetical protein